MSLEQISNLISAIEGVSTTLALIVGGYWSYRLFWKRRQIAPRANLEHQISLIPLKEDLHLLRVVARIENIGDVLLQIDRGFARLQLVKPLLPQLLEQARARASLKKHDENDAKLPFPLLKRIRFHPKDGVCCIEPGETDEITFDFVIQSKVKVVVVNTYFSNVAERKRELGWGKSSVFCIGTSGSKGALTMSGPQREDPHNVDRDIDRIEETREKSSESFAWGEHDDGQQPPDRDTQPVDELPDNDDD